MMLLRLTILLVAVILAVSCGPWPPGKDIFAAEFSENRGAFEALLREFQQSEYTVLEHGGASGGATGIDSSTGKILELQPEQGSYWQGLFEQARVYRIARVNDEVVFLSPVGPDIGGKLVRVEFIFRSGASDVPPCDDFKKNDNGVECEYPLDDGWFLRYFWTKES